MRCATHIPMRLRPAHRRGSVLAFVLILLALLTIFVSVWAYMSRLESQAARNVGQDGAGAYGRGGPGCLPPS